MKFEELYKTLSGKMKIKVNAFDMHEGNTDEVYEGFVEDMKMFHFLSVHDDEVMNIFNNGNMMIITTKY